LAAITGRWSLLKINGLGDAFRGTRPEGAKLPGARRSRPGTPGRTSTRPGLPRAPPDRLDPRPGDVAGVGFTTESCGCVGGRPRRGGTPVYDERVLPGATRLAVVPPHPRRSISDGRLESNPRIGVEGVLVISRIGT
jgi:hypothetical protein